MEGARRGLAQNGGGKSGNDAAAMVVTILKGRLMRERNEFVLADLIQIRAEQRPDLDVLTFEHHSLDAGATSDEVRTYADLAIRANALAAGFVAQGVSPGDRVALIMRNHPEFVEAMIACSITGSLFVPIDPRTRGDKLAFMLHNAGCVGVIASDECLPAVAEVRAQAPNLAWCFVGRGGRQG